MDFEHFLNEKEYAVICSASKDSTVEVQEIHRGRLIGHLQLVVEYLEASKKFPIKPPLKPCIFPWGKKNSPVISFGWTSFL